MFLWKTMAHRKYLELTPDCKLDKILFASQLQKQMSILIQC